MADELHPDLVRIGDREREAAAERLTAHAAAGRLTVEELEERLERAQAARVARDLHRLESDLPGPPRERRLAPPRWDTAAMPAVLILLLAAAVALSIAAGHPVPPLFIGPFLLWRVAGRRRGPLGLPR
jgi:hypothetical protein